jgi:hypothetical protein
METSKTAMVMLMILLATLALVAVFIFENAQAIGIRYRQELVNAGHL